MVPRTIRPYPTAIERRACREDWECPSRRIHPVFPCLAPRPPADILLVSPRIAGELTQAGAPVSVHRLTPCASVSSFGCQSCSQPAMRKRGRTRTQIPG